MAKIKTAEQYANRIIRDLVQGLSPEDRRHVHEGFRAVLKRILCEQFNEALGACSASHEAAATKAAAIASKAITKHVKTIEKLNARLAKPAKK
jgi:hypothetical protein